MRAGFAALALLALVLWMLTSWQLPATFMPLSHVLRLVVMLPLAALGIGLTFVLARHDALPRACTLVLLAASRIAAIVLDGFLARAAASLAFSGLSAAC